MRKAAAILILSVVPILAQAEDLNGYIFLAIKNGSAGGPVTDAMAKMIKAKTGSAETPQAKVEVVGQFQDPTCKRVRVAISQGGVKTLEGKVITLPIPPFELNICLNGRPPAETMDPAAVQARAEALHKQMGGSKGIAGTGR